MQEIKPGWFYYLGDPQPDLRASYPLFCLTTGRRIAEVIECCPAGVQGWKFRHQGKTVLKTSLLTQPLPGWRDEADPNFYERTIEGFKTTYGRKVYERITGSKVTPTGKYHQPKLF